MVLTDWASPVIWLYSKAAISNYELSKHNDEPGSTVTGTPTDACDDQMDDLAKCTEVHSRLNCQTSDGQEKTTLPSKLTGIFYSIQYRRTGGGHMKASRWPVVEDENLESAQQKKLYPTLANTDNPPKSGRYCGGRKRNSQSKVQVTRICWSSVQIWKVESSQTAASALDTFPSQIFRWSCILPTGTDIDEADKADCVVSFHEVPFTAKFVGSPY